MATVPPHSRTYRTTFFVVFTNKLVDPEDQAKLASWLGEHNSERYTAEIRGFSLSISTTDAQGNLWNALFFKVAFPVEYQDEDEEDLRNDVGRLCSDAFNRTTVTLDNCHCCDGIRIFFWNHFVGKIRENLGHESAQFIKEKMFSQYSDF